jgi:hypothetical protein
MTHRPVGNLHPSSASRSAVLRATIVGTPTAAADFANGTLPVAGQQML